MIDDLDRSLEQLLRRELPAGLVAQIAISFAPPDSQFPPQSVTLPAVDLFLYDIQENRDLRDSEWTVERNSNGTTTRRRPPVRVDCSYLVTAWASEASPTRALDEHRLLSAVLEVLLRYPALPEQVLQGRLSGQRPPLPAATVQPGRLQSLGEFWQALGGKPKASFNYTVTIGVEPEKPSEGPPVVTDSAINYGPAS